MSKFQLLTSRPLFYAFVLISGILIFSGWYCVSAYVASDMRARLDSEVRSIESHSRERMRGFTDGLIYARSLFSNAGSPTTDVFGKFVADLEPGKRIAGLRSIGYARLTRKPPAPLATSITLLAPLSEKNSRFLDFDMAREKGRRQTMLLALNSGNAALSGPTASSVSAGQPDFLLYLPLFDSSLPIPENATERKRAVQGFLFAVINAEDYFNGVFGRPDLSNETVNFEVRSRDPDGHDQLLYTRFGSTAADPGLEQRQNVDIQGRHWEFRVKPLPHFYNWSDRYLPLLAGVIGFLFFLLGTFLLRAMQNELLVEIQARARIEADGRKLRRLSSRLQKMNETCRDLIAMEQDARWGETYLAAAVDLARADRAFIYFESPEGGALHLVGTVGFMTNEELPRTLPVAPLTSAFRGHLCLSADRLAHEPDAPLTAPQGWEKESGAFFRLPKRPVGTAGILYLARTGGSLFEEDADKLIEALLLHGATILEMKSHLRRAEDGNLAKSAFLANMSHEIRTPLNAILGFSSLLAREEIPAEEKHRTLHLVRKNGEQLTRIIDDILDLSKVESGRVLVQETWTSLPSLLSEIRSAMNLRARHKKLSFDVRLRTPIPQEIFTDSIRLKQILMNVAGNGVKFTEKGAVELAVAFEQNPGSSPTLILNVTDSGIGIPAALTKNLFTPFHQGDDSHTRRYGGPGLGLALSRKLARQLHGDLSLIESSAAGGSVFRLQIDLENRFRGPLTAQLAADPGEASQNAEILPRLDNRKVLLVEDSPDNQDIFRYYLETAGADVHIEDNGRTAIEEALARPYDLVLMDIQIPEVDGLVATRTLRSRGFEKPILALTAHAMHEEKNASLRAGCNGHLVKPITAFDLTTAVYNTLKEPSYPEPPYDHFGNA